MHIAQSLVVFFPFSDTDMAIFYEKGRPTRQMLKKGTIYGLLHYIVLIHCDHSEL